MKVFIVFACVVAAASAGVIAPIAPLWASGPQHLPVIGPNGVPVDTPAVQQARAAHLTQKIEAHARNGDLIAPVGVVGAVPAVSAVAPVSSLAGWSVSQQAIPAQLAVAPVVARAVPAAWPTTLGTPAVTANGVPLETPEVVAAKSTHFAAHAEAWARNSPIISGAVVGAPVIAQAPIVANAALASPIAVAGAVPAAWPTTLGTPAVTANGVPLETREVVAAKSTHFAAHAEALTRNSPISSGAVVAAPWAAPVASLW